MNVKRKRILVSRETMLNTVRRLYKGESLKIYCQIKCERNNCKRLGKNTKIQRDSAFGFICGHIKFSFHFKELQIANGDDAWWT